MSRLVQAHKVGPTSLVAQSGTTNLDSQEHNTHPPNIQANNHEWWSRELQRALDILSEPRFCGLQIQIMGQAGCGYHPPTSDPDELERFAREVGFDASYSIVTANGRVSWPVLIDLSPRNGPSNTATPQIRGRVIA
ncbi:MAG: hypothetical protein O7D91_08430 [Planctomycetota bacterium]|nr:hypothetical protein [Planctomycetota bacterium]